MLACVHKFISQVAVTEKSSGFKMTDVGFIQDLLKTHESQQSSKFPASNAKRMVAAGELQGGVRPDAINVLS